MFLNNLLQRMLGRARQTRQQRNTDAEAELALDNLLDGFEPFGRPLHGVRGRAARPPDDFPDEHNWSPDDERDRFFDW